MRVIKPPPAFYFMGTWALFSHSKEAVVCSKPLTLCNTPVKNVWIFSSTFPYKT